MISRNVLNPVGLIEGIPEELLSEIADVSKEVEYLKGELIFEEGEKAEYLYLLVEGKISIRVQLTSRPESISVAILNRSYQSFGWSGVVAPYHYTASALCETECHLLAIPGQKLIEILKREPASGFEVMRRISEVISSCLRNSRSVLLKTL